MFAPRPPTRCILQGSCPGYTGGATDTYGMYPGAGDKAQIVSFL